MALVDPEMGGMFITSSFLFGVKMLNRARWFFTIAPGYWLPDTVAWLSRYLAAQQAQDALGEGVGLCQHGRACLLQNLGARQVGGFGGEVSILNAAT